MGNNNIFDVIVIGSGPSGMMASVRLIEAGYKVALIDKGGNYYTRAELGHKDLVGFGGAAMRYDANLDYSSGIPRKSNLGERVFGSKKRANTYIKEVYNRLGSFGLAKREQKKGDIGSVDPEMIDRGIIPVGEEESMGILRNIYDHLMNNNATFFEFTEVLSIVKKEIFEIEILASGEQKSSIKGRRVILATGKLSIQRARKIFDSLGVAYERCDSIDVGVRIETKKKATDAITAGCVNPKIFSEYKGITSRTFCWCPGGRVIDYAFEGAKIIDGQHCHDDPTDQTNFGIVATIKLPKWVDGTNFGIDYIRMVNEFTGGKAGVQRMKDFKKGKATTLKALRKGSITPTILEYALVDLNMTMMPNIREGILNLIDMINKRYPKTVGDNSLICGPVLERIFPRVKLSSNMESSIEGFYVVGDISGKAIGVVTGAAMGIRAALDIIESKHEKH